jgi:ribonuclease J
MTAVETDGRIVIVDTGLMFPTADMLGIDLVLPDFSTLRERADDIEAIVLTHSGSSWSTWRIRFRTRAPWR